MMWWYGQRGEVPPATVFAPYVPCPRCGDVLPQQVLDEGPLCYDEFLEYANPIVKVTT